jgi:hypothetical protein
MKFIPMSSAIDSPDLEVPVKKIPKKRPIVPNNLIKNFSDVKSPSRNQYDGSFKSTTIQLTNHLESSKGHDIKLINSASSSNLPLGSSSFMQSNQTQHRTISLGLNDGKKNLSIQSSNFQFVNLSNIGFRKSPIKNHIRNSTSNGKSNINLNFQKNVNNSNYLSPNDSGESPVNLSRSQSHQYSSRKDRNSPIKMSTSRSHYSDNGIREITSTSTHKGNSSPLKMSKAKSNYSYDRNGDNNFTSSRKDCNSPVKISTYSNYGIGQNSSGDEESYDGESSDSFKLVKKTASDEKENVSIKHMQRSENLGNNESDTEESDSDNENLFYNNQSYKNGKRGSVKKNQNQKNRSDKEDSDVSKSSNNKRKSGSTKRAVTRKRQNAVWSTERQFESSFEIDMESKEMIKLQRKACVAFINQKFMHIWHRSHSNGGLSL